MDGVRAVACLVVVIHHAGVPGFGPMGQVGVDVFFVLSGYLITGILRRHIETGNLNYGAFCRARVRRLVPALAAMVAIVTLAGAAISLSFGAKLAISAMVSLAYISDFNRVMGWGLNLDFGHTWTLALEMQFYLVWPWALALIMRSPRPGAILWGMTAAFAALYPFSPPVWADANPVPLLIGAALAFRRVTLPAQLDWIVKALSWRPLVSLGLLSYGVYLWHPVVAQVLRGEDWTVRAAVTVTLSIALAALSYLTIERWAGCAKAPLWPSRSSVQAVTEAAA
jgi:peptidoglycan/LPS O-acetylase OafA/YrhL